MQQTNRIWNLLITLIFLFLLYGAIRLLEPILMPFLFGALLAYLSDPLVNKLTRLHLSRTLAATLVFLLVFSIIIVLFILVVPLIYQQIDKLISLVSSVSEWLQLKMLPWLIEKFNFQETMDANSVKNLFTENISKAGNIVTWFIGTVLKSGKALFESLLNIILIPVVTFYLLRDWDMVISNIKQLLPRKIKPTIVKIVSECDVMLGAFFRGQLLVMFLLGIYYAVGLTLVGLQVGVMIGFLVGIVSIVPYLGAIIGITISVIAAMVQFGTISALIKVGIVFIIGHLLENVILTPKLIGDRIGLHPVAVIFAVLAGGTLFGFFGVLLALPVAAVVMVLLKHLQHRYYRSELYKA